jgi:hypothetical protein
MVVDVKIAVGLNGHVDQAVPRQLLEHMVQKADPGRHGVSALAIQIHRGADPRFGRIALDASASRWRDRSHAPF